MKSHCQFHLSWLVRLSPFVAATIAASACSDSTAPVVPTKYIVTTSTTSALVGDTVIVAAQLVDANGHDVHTFNKRVTWYTVSGDGHFTSDQSVTDKAGVATNLFIVGTKANVTCVIFVMDENQLRGDAPPIAVMAGPPSVYAVTSSTLTADVGTTISLRAQLMDGFGNPIAIAGRVITWSVANGDGYYYQVGVQTNRLPAPIHARRASTSGGTFASPTSTTNGQGVATVDFNVGTVNGSYVIVAQDDKAAVGSSAPITVRPGPIAKFVVTVSVTDPPAGAAVVLTAYPADSYDNRITTSGIPVSWSATGGGTLSSAVTNTGQDGTATNQLTTGPTPGTSYTVTVSGGSQTGGTSPAITTLEQISLSSLSNGFGSESSCGIATNGRVWCWGTRNGLLPSRPLPGKPIGDQMMSVLSTAVSHTCGITGGTVFCWGADGSGELGDNATTARNTPAPINSSLSFTAVSAGSQHTCAIATTGAIYCWGRSDSGRLGDGTGFTGLGPIKVAGTVTFTALSAGDAHTCAIAVSGDAYCWGANEQGQLGNGSVTTASTPTLVSGGLKFTAIAAGVGHTCGIAAGAVYCWGDNTFGEIGDGSTTRRATAPTAVKSTSTFVAIAAGGFHVCAIASDASAYCWGDNTTRELGDPTFTQSHAATPIAVSGGLRFASIAVGGSGSTSGNGYYGYYGPSAIGHSCGVTTDGVTYCWGSNSGGELGISSFSNSSATPTKVSGQH
jgi:alpha-tubulin suppressor-like RCC1 family protein